MALLSHWRTCIQASTHMPHASSNITIGHNTTQPQPALSHVVHRRCCISYSDHLSLSQLSQETLRRYRDTAQTGKSPTPQLTARIRAHTHTGQALLLNFYFPTACQCGLRLSRSLIPSALTCASPLCAYRFEHTTSTSDTPYPHACICTL